MGGLTGLPRLPVRVVALTKAFNPTGEYREPIATLYRDLERTLGSDEDLTLRVLRRNPSLLNPAVANRFVFSDTKRELERALGSERAAIDKMAADPSLLLSPGNRYDTLNPRLERLLADGSVGAAKGGAPEPMMFREFATFAGYIAGFIVFFYAAAAALKTVVPDS